jgi:hypothetical protein
MTVSSDRQRTWRFPRPMLRGHIAFGSLMWAGLVVVSLAIAAAFAWFTEVPGSIWEDSSQVAAWYVGGVSGYIAYQTVPMLIAHGRTRRDSAIEMVIFMAVFAAVAAVLVAAGYLIEYVMFGVAGWPRDLSGEYPFSSQLDTGMVFIQSWLTFLVWAASGALVGGAIYRYRDNGWLALIPASILVGAIGIFTQSYRGPVGFLIDRFPSVETPSLPLAMTTAIACFLIALALTWPILRDLPIRTR